MLQYIITSSNPYYLLVLLHTFTEPFRSLQNYSVQCGRQKVKLGGCYMKLNLIPFLGVKEQIIAKAGDLVVNTPYLWQSCVFAPKLAHQKFNR